MDRSPLDDSPSVFLSVIATDPLPNPYGFGDPTYAGVIIRCKENTTAFFITFGDSLMFPEMIGRSDIDYRLDQDRPGRKELRPSSDMKALGLWRGDTSIPFIKTLLEKDQLFIRAYPMGSSPVEATFPISGLGDAIVPLREACGW
jgi:type VI secretion system protein VasI